MNVCAFFGHRNSPESVYERLKAAIVDLITEERVSYFLVGNNGAFDSLVYKALKELSENYSFSYNVVLAYVPKERRTPQNSILPDNFEKVPKKFAIDKRNDYMLKKANYIICYVTHYMGGAGKFAEKAERQHKRVINLAKDN